MMDPMLGIGCLDGQSMIEMNNLTVGYYPAAMPEIGVYPVPVPVGPGAPETPPLPGVEQQDSRTRS